jgi:hypothetical protein
MAREKKSSAAAGTQRAATKGGKATKAARPKAPRGEKWKQIVAAFRLTRQRDPQLPWWMLIVALGAAALVFGLLTLLGGPVFITIPVAVLAALVGAMFTFGRRAQKAVFREVEGKPGGSVWVLQNMRGNWRLTENVQMNAQLDMVHRVLGRPGVILVGEGTSGKVRGLMAQEKKRVARIAGDTPIYDVQVGDAEGEIALRKLSAHLMKLPRNLTPAQVNAMEKRLQALGGTKAPPLPKGPMPKGARMPGLERTMRRR